MESFVGVNPLAKLRKLVRRLAGLMMTAEYYREQAGHARRLARNTGNHPDVVRQLHDMAQDLEDLAGDIEVGAIGVQRPDLLSPRQRG